MADREKEIKESVILTGQKLYERKLVVARSGNLSARLLENVILMTATGTSLGSLKPEEVIKVDMGSEIDCKNKRLSSEFPLHSLIYRNFPAKAVIHCHPALINGYFAVNDKLETHTFETQWYLGNVPVVPQETPTVTKPEAVIDALKTSNIVVLKNHGVVAMGDNFNDCFYLIEELQEAVRVAAIARIFSKEKKPAQTTPGPGTVCEPGKCSYEMFSPEHIKAIVDLVNRDEFILQKGKELELTVKLAVKLDGTDKAYTFSFEQGKIVDVVFNAEAPFVISAPKEVWQQVFFGKLDSFVAVTQGKMKLVGQLGQLSKWYVPFTRLFAIFKEVAIK